MRRHGYHSPLDFRRHDHTAMRRHLGLPANPTTLPYDGFQSPAAAPASGRVSPESHDAIATISAWS